MEYLGFWVTRYGIKPIDKIQPIKYEYTNFSKKSGSYFFLFTAFIGTFGGYILVLGLGLTVFTSINPPLPT